MEDIPRKCNLIVGLSKFTSNKKILNKIVIWVYKTIIKFVVKFCLKFMTPWTYCEVTLVKKFGLKKKLIFFWIDK